MAFTVAIANRTAARIEMSDTLEQRVSDLEHIIAHLPEDLDARFAGVEVKLAQIRETQLLHTQRFTTLETKFAGKLSAMDNRLNAMDRKLDAILASLSKDSG